MLEVANLAAQRGALWQAIVERSQYAVNCGALQSIPTNYEFIEQNGIQFLVRILTNLVRKDAATQQQQSARSLDKPFNPFLPYEDDLFVCDLSPTHVCLLNKFNVVEHHILLITRAFEDQESLLTLLDFEALAIALQEIDGLAFYNGGKVAGASQPHKHLQLVPLPFQVGAPLPIAPAIAAIDFVDGIGTVAEWPFVHAIAPLQIGGVPAEVASTLLATYIKLLTTVGFSVNLGQTQQPGAYNLLATREWMMIVPRSQEEYRAIGVNSLGFSGALLVRNQEQMDLIKQLGPMGILENVGILKGG